VAEKILLVVELLDTEERLDKEVVLGKVVV
jgi:hypothetical protein